MKKAILAGMMAMLFLAGCSAESSVPASSRAESPTASSAAASEVQAADFTLTSSPLTEEENRFLSLVGSDAILYDYEASADEVSVSVTSYQVENGQLRELNTIELPTPCGRTGRIAVSFNKMVEGFRVAVETNEKVNSLGIDAGGKFPENTACVSWMAGFQGQEYAYGQEVPLVSQVSSSKDTTESISAEDLLNHPEQFADADYEGIYLMTLTIKPTNKSTN